MRVRGQRSRLTMRRLFRLHPTKHGAVVQPHSILGWIVCATVFAVLAIPYIWATRGTGSAGPFKAQNPFAYRALVFYALWLGGWSSTSPKYWSVEETPN